MSVEFAFPWSQAHWWIGLGIALIVIVGYGLKTLEKGRDIRLGRFVDLRLGERLLIGHDAKMRTPLFWFSFIGFVCLILTLAQPRWGESWQEVRQSSRDIVVCLDVSESMRAENPLPNRLERAKQKIASFMELSPGDRFALVPFSGAAELMCPLTLDRGYYASVLNAVDTDSISLEGTDLAAALTVAVETFQEQEKETGDFDKNSRAILLISDGEAIEGDALAAAEEAAKYARIFVLGVGSPRGVEVEYTLTTGRGGRRNSQTFTHLSKLDEDSLMRIAVEAGGGAYIRSTPGNDDVNKIHEIVRDLSAREVSSDLRMQLMNRFQWPLALAIICFVGEGLWLVLLPTLRKSGEAHPETDGVKQHV